MEVKKLFRNKEVCRLCLESRPTINIFTQGKTVLEMISSLCLVIVRENDNMPRKICIQCLKLLQQFKQFRKMCLETDKVLQEQNNIFYTKDPIKTELLDDFCTEGTIKIEPCDDEYKINDEQFQNDVNSAPDNHSDSDQSEDWFEKYFTESKQSKEKQEVKNDKNARAMCHVCGKTITKYLINEHLVLHSTETKHSCSICPMKFKSKSTYKKHIKTHTDIRVPCDICHKSLANLSILKKHKAMVHSENEKRKCDVCGKIYKNKLLLQSHRERHVKRYKCKYCESIFADRNTTRRHEILHTGETPHKCPCCSKAYALLDYLKSHFKHNHKGIIFSEVYKPIAIRKNLKTNTETPKDMQ